MKIVKIIWKDARTETDVIGLKDIKEKGLCEVHSIGYLVDENEDRIAICSFFFPEEDGTNAGFRDVHFIPKSWIIKIEELKQSKQLISLEEARKLIKEKNETKK